jgi:hypothetical protein
MELGSGEVSGNSTLANLMDDGSVPTGLEYDLDTTIGLYSSHVGVKSVFGEPNSWPLWISTLLLNRQFLYGRCII